ncbi:MAG TPA: hypothetical protein VK154_01740 [Chitinophagales bacterium]|nr:hypothetical protein [Chitinophagales bacterium]
MKKTMLSIAVAIIFALSPQLTHAQAWERNTKVLAIGFGPSQFFHLDRYYYDRGPRGFRSFYWPLTGQFNFQGEFGVHKYVGLGFTTGIGGRGPYFNDYAGEINVPIGFLVNFHFYQLIADHASRDIKSDKLDIYAGLTVGSGLAFAFYPGLTRVVPIAFGGPHVGLRYYFAPRVGINGEFGFGRSIANVGFVFKI